MVGAIVSLKFTSPKHLTVTKHLSHALALVLLVGFPLSGSAEVNDYTAYPNSPSYEMAAAPLRQAPPSEFKFAGARLGDVLQLLADEAGISFFSLPDDTEAGNRIVTFTINASPFLALETLTKANGIALIYDNGIWYLRPENDTQLIGRVYEINYNSREMVTTQSGGGGGSGSSGSNGGFGGANALTGIDLQGSTPAFEVEVSKLLEDIRELLDIPINQQGVLAGSTSVDSLSQGQGMASTIMIPQGVGAIPGPTQESNELGGSAKVIWNSDANTLFVVGTRQQHQWIEGYLAASDKPQDQIAIEIKFFETSRDPNREFGFDWTDTLDDGYEINLSEDGDPLSSTFNLNNPSTYVAPSTAILSFEQVNLKLRALVNDSETRTVSYPRMVTTNNREVKLRSVVNQPVLASSTSASLGTGATTAQEVSYLPIGTVINLLPKKLGSGKVQLNVSLTISNIIDFDEILGSTYPIASSRVYTAPVEVSSGYTIAIGGLDEANWTKSESGVPGLRKLPILGHAFKSTAAERGRNSLIIFITPTIIEAENGGLPDEPQSRLRSTPHDPVPPRLQPDGSFFTNIQQIPSALESLHREVAILEQITEEYAVEDIHKERAAVLRDGLKISRDKVLAWKEAFPDRAAEFDQYDADLASIQQRLSKLQRKVRWMLN